MSSFSAEHKLVEDWYRQTFSCADDNPCQEDLTTVSVIAIPIRNEMLDVEINRMLSSIGLDVYLKQKDDEKKARADKVRKMHPNKRCIPLLKDNSDLLSTFRNENNNG